MRRKRLCLHADRQKRDFSFLLFLLSAFFSVVTTYYVSAHYIDSDTSTELILARHWIETGNILSSDWLYGSELRLFHVQLIYVPLMLLLDNWMMVRFLGAVIMQVIYISAFGCLVYAAGQSRQFFFRGAALLLLPVSVTYGRIVLYHNHYLPNITFSFLLIALSMGFTAQVDWRSRNTWIRLFLLAGLSFAGGLNSIRQLMITHGPLLLTAFVFCWLEDGHSSDRSRTAFLKPENRNLIFCSVYSAAFSFLGLKAQNYLCHRLGLRIAIQSESNTMHLVEAEYFNDILYGFFHQFGFRNWVSLLSVSGILTVGSIFVGCYLLFIAVKKLIQEHQTQNRSRALLSVFFLAYTAVMMILFLATKGNDTHYYYPLYLSLCYSWAVPLLLITLEDLPREVHPLQPEKFFAIAACAVLLISGIVNTIYFQGSDRFPQTYEGLGFQNRDKKEELSEVVAYLAEQGYGKGYAEHWEGNIVTEMTDGQISMVPLFVRNGSGGTGNLSYAPYLYALWLRESPCEKSFVLVTEENLATFLSSGSSAYCTQIYSGHNHIAFHIDDPEAFVGTVSY